MRVKYKSRLSHKAITSTFSSVSFLSPQVFVTSIRTLGLEISRMSGSKHWTPSSLTYIVPDINKQSPNLQTALAFIDARNAWFSSTGGKTGVEQMMSLFDDSLEHRILPNSLARPVLKKNQYREYVQGLLRFIRTYKISLHEMIESNENSIVIHASSTGTSLSGVDFSNEYIIILHFKSSNEPGELPKIIKVKEWVDSKKTAEFFEEERRRAGVV
ncbi:hypothetical protein BDP27DRAFT_1318457 [Rhodocollybia butyracea]|uniref:Uncharacterized protein n=1 Tax=Rhodocollybia butyracea TaxID=206335 RepID=A0A9P5Q4R5_9AGAR|nr:hypothetical protein BDP27DRAFT_1318457 [Rhodocollybia butyracea]